MGTYYKLEYILTSERNNDQKIESFLIGTDIYQLKESVRDLIYKIGELQLFEDGIVFIETIITDNNGDYIERDEFTAEQSGNSIAIEIV